MRYNTRFSYQTFLTASSLGELEAITFQLYIGKHVVCLVLQYRDHIYHNCIIRQDKNGTLVSENIISTAITCYL